MSKYIRKRYIDAETLKSYLNPIARKTDCHFLQLIDNIPTAEVEEVRHGKWIRMPEPFEGYNAVNLPNFRCSLCGRQTGRTTCDPPEEYIPYCHCGAKMDGGKE